MDDISLSLKIIINIVYFSLVILFAIALFPLLMIAGRKTAYTFYIERKIYNNNMGLTQFHQKWTRCPPFVPPGYRYMYILYIHFARHVEIFALKTRSNTNFNTESYHTSYNKGSHFLQSVVSFWRCECHAKSCGGRYILNRNVNVTVLHTSDSIIIIHNTYTVYIYMYGSRET